MALTTVQLGMQGSPQFYAFKNRIINGTMVIDQRNAGASVTIDGTAGTYTLDRWLGIDVSSGSFTVQQDSAAPSGFINSSKLTVASTVTSYATTDSCQFMQRIEGYNITDLGWGTANAKTVTLSFWVRSSLTGTFGGAIKNSGSTRSYPYSYTISSADTWEQKSITISGDTTGTWLTTNGIGAMIIFCLGAGTDRLGTAGTWNANNNVGATSQTNVMATSGATFYITGVQLEVGSTASSFDYRPYGTELALCQRYYYKSISSSSNAYLSNFGSTVNSTIARFATAVPVEMRSTPTIGYSNVGIDKHTASYSISNLAIFGGISKTTVGLAATSSGMTGDQPVVLYSSSGATGYIDYSAEL